MCLVLLLKHIFPKGLCCQTAGFICCHAFCACCRRFCIELSSLGTAASYVYYWEALRSNVVKGFEQQLSLYGASLRFSFPLLHVA